MTDSETERPGKSIASLVAPVMGEVEPPGRLSESSIWERQRRYYAGDAAGIWGTGAVPHYVTSNPRIASTYARMTLEFLRAVNAVAPGDGEPAVPHVVELGGGTGRFAYLFVRHLRELAPGLDFVYVLTDFEPERVQRWAEHPSFQPLIEDGLIDFAVLDADQLGPLELIVSGRMLTPSSLQGPLVGIANYIFDTLRNESYVIRRGELSECHISVPTTACEVDGAPAYPPFEAAEWHAAIRGAVAPDLEPILDYYAATLDDTVVLAPVGGLRCLEFLDALTSGPSCALVADKGHCTPSELCGQATPSIVDHGDGFSVMVNFDLVARWIRQLGGTALLPREPSHSLVVAALIRGEVPGAPYFEAWFHDQLLDLGPDNYFVVRPLLTSGDATSIRSMLASLRLSRFDPSLFVELLPTLLATVPTVPDSMKNEIERALFRVWQNYFPIGEPVDMALCVGLALSAMSRFGEAVDFLERSVKEHETSAEAAFAMAVARHGQRDLQAASDWVERALVLEPGFPDARALRAMMQDEFRGGIGS